VTGIASQEKGVANGTAWQKTSNVWSEGIVKGGKMGDEEEKRKKEKFTKKRGVVPEQTMYP